MIKGLSRRLRKSKFKVVYQHEEITLYEPVFIILCKATWFDNKFRLRSAFSSGCLPDFLKLSVFACQFSTSFWYK